MAIYTLVQLGQVLVFGVFLLYGLLSHRPSLAVFSAGLLIGIAVLNILAPEGGTVVRRTVLGYGLGAVYTVVAIVAVKFLA